MKHGLIDRRDFEDWLIENCTRNMAQLVKGYIKEQPTVDAVQVPCYVGDEIWYVPDYNKKPFRIRAFDRMIKNHPGEIRIATGEVAESGGGYDGNPSMGRVVLKWMIQNMN